MNLDTFTRAYVECALWSSTDENGYSLDDNDYTLEDIAPETLARMADDCAVFQRDHDADLGSAGGCARVNCDRYAGDERNGHDFWLTRNRHGVGFWARGYPEALGRRLTDAAHAYGSFDLYIGDDGKVHGG